MAGENVVRWGVLALGLGAFACSPNASGVGESGGGVLEGGASATEGEGSATGMSGGSGVVDGTGDGATQDPSTSGTTNPQTTAPPEGSGEGETTGDDDGMGATTTGDDGPMPTEQEVLERANFANCDTPLWCFIEGNVFNPAAGQTMWMQECFSATLPTPFELQELEIVVAGSVGFLGDVQVQVHANNGPAGPGGLLGEQTIAPGSLANGLSTITLNPPLVIHQQEICIGVASPNPLGALGIAVDEASNTNNASYFQIFAGAGCIARDWTDVTDVDTTPSGNWCIRGTIETP